jgi:hypothetical protein
MALPCVTRNGNCANRYREHRSLHAYEMHCQRSAPELAAQPATSSLDIAIKAAMSILVVTSVSDNRTATKMTNVRQKRRNTAQRDVKH